MANCSAGKCKISCPGGGCGCVSAHDNPNLCLCFCNVILTEPERPEWLTLASEVDFHAQDLPLTALAAVFDCVFPNRIAIPAVRSYSKLTMKIEKVKCGELLKQCNLIVLERPYEAVK